jgi:hypothetical protein
MGQASTVGIMPTNRLSLVSLLSPLSNMSLLMSLRRMKRGDRGAVSIGCSIALRSATFERSLSHRALGYHPLK